jgi:myosin-5
MLSVFSIRRKTETTKFIMRYLADSTMKIDKIADADEADKSIERRVLLCNPILESFGNAKTLRNDNSSRFGKFIEINFARSPVDHVFRICGATIRTYLLEKVRLVHQTEGERNYHCFYELINGCDDSKMAELGLDSVWHFNYTNQSSVDVRHDGVDDAAQYTALLSALDVLGFSEFEKNNILKVVAAVLHLGNLEFSVKESKTGEDDGSMLADACLFHADHCCELLGIEKDLLQKALCEKVIRTPEKLFEKMLSVDEAEQSRDALAKSVYGSLFDWLVTRVNEAIIGEEGALADKGGGVGKDSRVGRGRVPAAAPKEHRFIGLLDIFGFESFLTNSFEQVWLFALHIVST